MEILIVPTGPIQANCVVVSDNQEALVVDPGDDASKLISIMKKQGLKIKYIVITHGHFDHAGAAGLLKQALGGELCIHEEDKDLYLQTEMQAATLGFGIPSSPINPDKLLKQNDALEVGSLTAKVVHTPGHSPGSICLYFEDQKQPLLISGDTLFRGSVGRTDLWGGSAKQIQQSLKILSQLPPKTRVICGHGPETTIQKEKNKNPYFDFE